MQTIQAALSELLAAQGFDAMAEGVKFENDQERVRKYARVVLKNAPQAMKQELVSRFSLLNLI